MCDIEFEGAEEEEATNRIEGYINEHPDMVAACGTTGGSAIAWSAAKEDTERTDIIVVGFDYTESNISILEEGGVAGLVARPCYGSAYKSAQVLNEPLGGADYSTGDKWRVFRVFVDTPIVSLDGEDVSGIDYYKDIFARTNEYFGE